MHHDPHGLLGPHRDGASLVIRAWQPGADAVTLVLGDGRERAMRRVEQHGLFTARLRRTTVPGYRFDVARDGRFGAPGRRPLRVRSDLGALDLHLIGEGRHRRLWERARRPPARARRGAGRRVRGLGAQGARGRASSATSTAGTGALTRCADGRLGRLGAVRARRRRGRAVQVRDPRRRRPGRAEGRPDGAPGRACRPRRRRSSTRRALRVERRRVDGGPPRAPAASREPMSIYEVHLGSWRATRRGHRSLTYRSFADGWPTTCGGLGFTHVELMPVIEHPFGGSWGYQVTGYFAPTRRFGTPDDLRYLIDRLHQRRHRRDPRLGAGPLPEGRLGLAPFDGTRALRARRSAPGRAPGLGHADLQLRPHRGAELPDRQRALLAGGVPRRRPAGRRRRLDALPRLLAQGRASGCRTGTAAARTWRRSRSCAS